MNLITMMMLIGSSSIAMLLSLQTYVKNHPPVQTHMAMILEAKQQKNLVYMIPELINKDDINETIELSIDQTYTQSKGSVKASLKNQKYNGVNYKIIKLVIEIPENLKGNIGFQDRHYDFMNNIGFYFKSYNHNVDNLNKIFEEIEVAYSSQVLIDKERFLNPI